MRSPDPNPHSLMRDIGIVAFVATVVIVAIVLAAPYVW